MGRRMEGLVADNTLTVTVFVGYTSETDRVDIPST